MKNFCVSLCVIVFWGIVSNGWSVNCEHINKDVIAKYLPDKPTVKYFLKMAKIAHKRKIKGYCEVILELSGRYYSCYVGDDYVFMGNLFFNGKRADTEIITLLKNEEIERQKSIFIEKRRELDKVVAFFYKPTQSSKKVLYMFTDPLCPFCHKAESKIKELVTKYNVTLKVVLYSVHSSKGIEKAIEAVCRGFNLDEYIKEGWRKENKTKDFQCEKGKQLLANSLKIVRILGIRSVPTFIFEDGTRVRGFDLKRLEDIMKK